MLAREECLVLTSAAVLWHRASPMQSSFEISTVVVVVDKLQMWIVSRSLRKWQASQFSNKLHWSISYICVNSLSTLTKAVTSPGKMTVVLDNPVCMRAYITSKAFYQEIDQTNRLPPILFTPQQPQCYVREYLPSWCRGLGIASLDRNALRFLNTFVTLPNGL